MPVFRVHVLLGMLGNASHCEPRCLKQTCPDEASVAATFGKLRDQADGDHFPNRGATPPLVLPLLPYQMVSAVSPLNRKPAASRGVPTSGTRCSVEESPRRGGRTDN
jgi:hypothetical protein